MTKKIIHIAKSIRSPSLSWWIAVITHSKLDEPGLVPRDFRKQIPQKSSQAFPTFTTIKIYQSTRISGIWLERITHHQNLFEQFPGFPFFKWIFPDDRIIPAKHRRACTPVPKCGIRFAGLDGWHGHQVHRVFTMLIETKHTRKSWDCKTRLTGLSKLAKFVDN